jgi:hypothetical protein
MDVDTNIGSSDFERTDFRLLVPSITDYTVSSQTQDGSGADTGKSQLTGTFPSSGDWTLWIAPWRQFNNDFGGPAPYSFIATIVHATSVAVQGPTLARRGSTLTIRGSVHSPAGTPAGTCLIAGNPVPLTSGGTCTGRVRMGHDAHSTVGVSFVGDDGWQSSSGHRTIRLYQ